MLTAEEYKFVLTEACPPKPGERETDEETHAYRKWKMADKVARYYILASMSNVLQHQHKSFATGYDTMLNLKDKFGDQDHGARQVVMKDLMNTTLAEGTHIKYHVLKMINLLNELEILGAEIDGETQFDIILQSLSELLIEL